MKEDIHQLISGGQTQAAIQALIAQTKQGTDLHDQALALSARYQNYRKKQHSGTTDDAYLDEELNRIQSAAIELANKLGGTSNSSNKKRTLARLALWLGIFAAVAGITGYTLRDFFKEKTPIEQQEESITEDDSPSEEKLEKTKTVSPVEAPAKAGGNTTNIQINDSGKVGTVTTGDSNTIEIKQDF